MHSCGLRCRTDQSANISTSTEKAVFNEGLFAGQLALGGKLHRCAPADLPRTHPVVNTLYVKNSLFMNDEIPADLPYPKWNILRILESVK